ncbi:acetyl-CoA C-acyltransferase [Humidisolicoccus flavus]|uniref:acetyl-CoA C-acyltransferase n=1 Tax=Humidisolicoccus flavus TaxID=3111414 RepID=UPI00325244B1
MSTVIVGYRRTPFVKFCGVFAQVSSVTLGAHAAKAALASAGVSPDSVDQVVVGQVLQAGVGQNPPRQTAVAAGVPMRVPAIGINAVCLSGAEAVVAAHRLIAMGEADVVLVVGQESMSLAPHAWNARAGHKFGPVATLDTMEFDGLTDAFQRQSMGASTESFNEKFDVTRDVQDAFAASSHERVVAAQAAGVFEQEISPIEVAQGRTTVMVSSDDGVRAETTAESLGTLRGAFAKDGTITAGNASQLSDGAAALVLTSSEYAARHGLSPLAEVLSTRTVAGDDVSLHTQPSDAIERALSNAGLQTNDLRAVEINEAFAAVGVVSTAALGVDPAIVNANGGAIALGHPIGASGARIAGHLAMRLRALGDGAVGALGICGGGGQGTAIVLRAVAS